MKLVLAIVSNDDSSVVSAALTKEGFSVTKLATTGGFLMAAIPLFWSVRKMKRWMRLLILSAVKAVSVPKWYLLPPLMTAACSRLIR